MRRRSLPVLAAVLIAASGCADDTRHPGRALTVVATTSQVADLVRQVGGDRVGLDRILRPNADPHDYEPRPSDARAVRDAELVFRSGGDVDDWLSGLLEDAGGDARTVDLIDSVQRRGDDPHWWHDPRNAERAVAAIRGALIDADPGGAAGYRRNAAAYLARLRALDERVASCIGRLPASERKLVTGHDALGYYARRYGLEVVGALIPSLSTQAQASAKEISELVDRIRAERVKAIFPEETLSEKLERAVAREAGVRVGDALWADALGPKGSSGATYAGSVEANTRALAAGLSGGRVRCRLGTPGTRP